jgi:hypothetical protein
MKDPEDEAFEELSLKQGQWEHTSGWRKKQILETSMTRDEVDTMWQKAMQESIKDGEVYVRYHFAKLVAQHEREACAKLIESRKTGANELMDAVRDMEARAIRARGQA